MNRDSKSKGYKLSKKIISGVVLLSIATTVASCIIGYYQYRLSITKLYNDRGYMVGEMILDSINIDKVSEYSKTWKADEYYEKLKDHLDRVTSITNSAYIYMIVPSDDAAMMRYVYDSSGMELGAEEPLNSNGGAEMTQVYKTGIRSNNYFVRHSKKYGYLTSSVLPVFDNDSNVCALLLVDTNMEIIVSALLRYIVKNIIISASIFVLFCILYMIFMRKSVVLPIQTIEKGARDFSQDATNITEELLNIKTGDELQVLSESIIMMEQDIIKYVDDLTKVTAEKERIGAELNVAKQIQEDALPSVFPPYPNIKEFDIFASMNPAKEVGGDFYDFYMLDEHRLGIVMADVSGKGVPAALFMMISKTLIQHQAFFTNSPAEILSIVNDQLCQNNTSDMFVTVWLGILDLRSGVLTAANAGHEYPAIKHKDGEFELYMDKHGLVLGGMEGLKFHEYTIQLEKDDVLFVYTDGVPEATNANNELFGNDRMVAALNANKNCKVQDLLPRVRAEIDSFVGEAPQFDDITMLGIQYYGSKSIEPGIVEA